MIIYYAHSVSLYGTFQEYRDIKVLQRLGFEVCNPNEAEHAEGYKLHGMKYFNGVLDGCHVLAFRAHPGGDIPAGVAAEIEYMEVARKPIFELPGGIGVRTLSVPATRAYLEEIGHR